MDSAVNVDVMNLDNQAGTRSPHSRPSDWYLAQLSRDVDLIVDAVDGCSAATLTTPVTACPGWDVRQLVVHLGAVHRWATFSVVNGEPPPSMKQFEPDLATTSDGVGLAAWFRAGASELIATLASIDPTAPTWHPWPSEKVAAFWPTRQMHETAVHRWDIQTALGTPDPIPADVAADGIDEWFALVVPRRHERDGVAYPSGSFHVHCTDTDTDTDTDTGGEWLGWTDDDGNYQMVREHRKGDAALRGPAGAIYLTLWGRQPVNADELSPVGDDAVLQAWTSFGG